MEKIQRDIGPVSERYWIRASVWWSISAAGLPILNGRAEIFDGMPLESRQNCLRKVGFDRDIDDPVEMLENVEQVARRTITKWR